ncbi:MAG: 2-amino-4-hydroxy-6-hydroxymethyldihydropteridine diphosphokinase [Gammaproteobacteria bacterium]|nr:2-amino-4-hydroxy-6-hydroxymethyldihydropteridine diphosphokinase [Gammaproteobacteria bacterium]
MNTDTTKKRAVYIGLGSNIEQPYSQIKKAISALNDLPETEVLTDSGYYISKPMGPEDQPDYVNAVVEIETALDAAELLKNCQRIEQQQGRIKTRHWGERTIDLDILLYVDQQILTDDLTLPHPGIWQRDFVYIPLLKLNPEIEIPGKGMLNAIVESTVESVTDVISDFSCQFAGPISRDY